MATYTLRQYCEMLLRQAAGGYVPAEMELTPADVRGYVLSHYPAALTIHIRNKRQGDEDPFSGAEGAWLKMTDCLDTERVCECGKEIYVLSLDGIKYVELSNGQGINAVIACGGTPLTRVTIEQGLRLSGMEAAMAAPPCYWVERQRLVFTGGAGKVQVAYVPDPIAIGWDEPFPLPSDAQAMDYLEQNVKANIMAFLNQPQDASDDSAETRQPA